MPAVSYLKAQSYQDGHPGNSNPLDEQAFQVQVVNALQASPFWNSTAVIIAYDDSDGWYDHQAAPIVNASFSTMDSISGTNACGTMGVTPQLTGVSSGVTPVNGRCGYGPRQPLLVISPWAKQNFVDHTLTDQSSILLFIEQNWNLGRIGNGSADVIANPIGNMFNFTNRRRRQTQTPLILSTTTGLPIGLAGNRNLKKHINRRKFVIGGGLLTAAARRGISQMAHMPPMPPAPPLLDPERMASFVDPLPIPPVAKPAGRRP